MMAATAGRLTASPAFDDLDNSIEDFTRDDQGSPLFGLPSQHSGFKSSEGETEEDDEVVSEEPWSPPAWRTGNPPPTWYSHRPYSPDGDRSRHSGQDSRSREASHESYASAVEEDEDVTKKPWDIPLPRGSPIPARESPGRQTSPVKKEEERSSPFLEEEFTPKLGQEGDSEAVTVPEHSNNCSFLLLF